MLGHKGSLVGWLLVGQELPFMRSLPYGRGRTLSQLSDGEVARFTSGWSAGIARWAWPALGAPSRAR